jgi:hypothetical protein
MAVLTAPVLAGVEPLYGSPDLSAAISGTNEFDPGDEVTLPVIVSNTGLNTVIQVTSLPLSPPDAPNLAKLVQAGLSAGNAPVTIKSEPQQIGDIAGGASKSVNFVVKIDRNAPAGTYDLPLTLTYTINWIDTEGARSSDRYLKKTETIYIPESYTRRKPRGDLRLYRSSTSAPRLLTSRSRTPGMNRRREPSQSSCGTVPALIPTDGVSTSGSSTRRCR